MIKGYTLQVARTDSQPSKPMILGQLDDAIDHRLAYRDHRWEVQLCQVKFDGKEINCGPWRPPHTSGDTFVHTIGEANIGSRFLIKGRFRKLIRIHVVEIPLGEQVLAAGLTEVGAPYVFGVANGPEDPGTDTFDCSGFTMWAWQTVGIQMPHGAELQRIAPNVHNFSNPHDAVHGDLVFMWFPNTRGIPSHEASHVGLWHSPENVLDTRNPYTSPVGIRPAAGVIGYGRPT